VADSQPREAIRMRGRNHLSSVYWLPSIWAKFSLEEGDLTAKLAEDPALRSLSRDEGGYRPRPGHMQVFINQCSKMDFYEKFSNNYMRRRKSVKQYLVNNRGNPLIMKVVFGKIDHKW